MYCKIIEEGFREPLGDIQFQKMAEKQNVRGGKVFLEPLGGVQIFRGSVENPFRILSTEDGCF
jgi:hypothetical protein